MFNYFSNLNFKVTKNIILLFLIILGLILPHELEAQQATVKGLIKDATTNESLPGVSVSIKGTKKGTASEANGMFQISAANKDVLVFSYIGMASQEIEVGGKTIINVAMQTATTEMDQVVVVGYGTQRKQSLVGAIGTVKMADLKKQGNVSNLTDALTGAIPGVSVLSISGMPGGGDFSSANKIYSPSEILIRGKTTWNSSAPLILVDGVERPMNDIDISDVESISVLKDASATAVFGVKGGNGVILITTKRGVEGKTSFKVEFENSFETASKIVEVADVAEGARARNYAIERTRRFNQGVWTNSYTSDLELEYYKSGKYPYAYPNQNWQDIMLKDYAQSRRLNLTANGGTEKVKYFTSLSYNHVGDILKGENVGQGYTPKYSYDRVNIRSNFDFNISKTTKLSVNLAGMYGLQSAIGRNYTGQVNGIFPSLSNLSGEVLVKVYEDGVPGMPEGVFANPWSDMNFGGVSYFPRSMINMDYTLNQKLDVITKGLSFVGKLAYDNTFRSSNKSIGDPGVITKKIDKNFYLNGGYYDKVDKVYKNAEGSIADMNLWTSYREPTAGREGFGWVRTPNFNYSENVSLNDAERTLFYQLMLQYKRMFAKHNVGGMTMFSRENYERGSNWPNKREDWVGRATYDYNETYLFEVNGAYNGSQKFGPNYRFDFFPSVAGGWLVSNEKFFVNNAKWLDKLKVRYSYGMVGNDNVNTGSTWPYLTVWDTYSVNSMEANFYGYPGGYTQYIRYNEGNPGNPDLRWEKATKQNLGFEFGAFNNAIDLTIDVFKEFRNDMLIGASDRRSTVAPIFGKPAPPSNIGQAKSHGVEIVLNLRKTIHKDIDIWLNSNWTFAKSEVIYRESTPLTMPHQRPEGKRLGQTFSGISNGIYQSWDDIYSASGGANSGNNGFLLPGDLMMVDFNSDGRYLNIDDNAPYGYPSYPQNNYGISLGTNYKGFSLSANFVGAYNATRNISFAQGASSPPLFPHDNTYSPTIILGDTWSPEFNNLNPTYPALALFAKSYNPTGHYLEFDASFFRLQSAEVSYTLTKKLAKSLKMESLRFYVNGRNLILWTRMPIDGTGLDDTGFNYPTKRQFNVGVTAQF